MVLRPEPVAAALDELRRPDSIVILPDPVGERFTQSTARELSAMTHLIVLCPRYEGVDERIRGLVDREISIGDYVLTGGELPALVIVDAVLRLLPGAIEADSIATESFEGGLLEYPQYTRPATFRGGDVPAVLVSGDHGASFLPCTTDPCPQGSCPSPCRRARAPVAGLGLGCANDESLDLNFAGFEVLFVNAVVAYERVGKADDLAGVGWIGQNLLVAGHPRIEDDLSVSPPFRPEGFPLEDRSILKRQYRFHPY